MAGLVWFAAFAVLPTSVLHRILLIVPLVVVPALMDRAGPIAVHPVRTSAIATALPLVAAVTVPAGPLAVLMAIPWLAFCLWRFGRAILVIARRDERVARWSTEGVAHAFLVTGAVFLALDRAAIRPLGLPAVIVLLTAVHFHFAGYGLLTLLERAAERSARLWTAVVALVCGMVATASGFTYAAPAVSAGGAVLVGSAGIAFALSLLSDARRPEQGGVRRVAGTLSGAALLLGMPLGVGWAIASASGLGFLPLDLMIRTHGALNATAIVVASLLDASRPR